MSENEEQVPGQVVDEKPSRTRRGSNRQKPADDPMDFLSREEKADEESYQQIDDMLKANDLEGGSIRLTRRGPGETNFSYVQKFKIQEFDIDFIKSSYGGGDYIGQTFRSNGQMGKRFTFAIDKRFKGTIDLSDRDTREAVREKGPDLVRLFEVMREGKSDGLDMATMMQAMQKSQSDNMAMMMAMMQQSTQMMTSAMTSIASMSANKGGGGDDTVKALMPVLIAMINKGGNSNGGGIKDTIESMALLKGMWEKEGSDDGDKDESLMDKLFKFGGPLLNAMAAAKGGAAPRMLQAPAASPQPGAAGPQADGPKAEQPQAQPQVNTSEVTMLVMFLNGAEKDSDTGLYCDMFMDMITSEQIPMVTMLLNSADYLNQLYGSYPELLSRALLKKSWFDALKMQILGAIAEASTPPDQPQQPASSGSASDDSQGEE